MRHLRATVVCCALALIAGCSGSNDSGSNDSASLGAAEPDICATFWEGAADLREKWSVTANDDPVAGLMLAVSAPDELARFYDKLATVAPDEDLAADLEELSEHFDKSASATDIASDPFAVLAEGFVDGLKISAPYERVDDYLTESCPVPADLAAAAQGQTNAACERLASHEVTAEDSVAELKVFFDDAEASGPSAARPARNLRVAVDQLEPPASLAFEALGRIRFGDTIDLDDTFTELASSAQSECGLDAEALAGSVSSLLSSIGPAPGRHLTPNLFGRTCSEQEGPYLVAPFAALYGCDGHLDLLDLDTGVIKQIDSPPTNFVDFLPNRRGVWTSAITEHPAEGLEPFTWSATVRFVDFESGAAKTLTYVDHHPGQETTSTTPYSQVAYADADRVVVSLPGDDPSNPERTLRMLQWDGTVVSEHTFEDRSGFDFETIDGPSLFIQPGFDFTGGVLNLTSGELTTPTVTGLGLQRGMCPESDIIFEGAPDPDQIVASRVSGSGGAITKLGTIDRNAVVFGDGSLVETDQSFEYRDFEGVLRWSLDKNAVNGVNVVFGRLVATNTSGVDIVVDPTTGTEATGLGGDVTRFLSSVVANASSGLRLFTLDLADDVILIDQESDMVISDSDDVLTTMKLSDLCPG